MKLHSHPFLIAIVVTTFSTFLSFTSAQESKVTHRVKLKSGGEILGKVHKEPKYINNRLHIVIETESGGMLQLDKSRMVSKIYDLQEGAASIYHKLHSKADSLASHKEAAAWCTNQSGGETKYRNEINYHNRQILKIDPNDDKAWNGIKSVVTGRKTYRKRDGVWINDVERFKASGYTRVSNSWQSEEALRLIERLDAGSQKGVINDAVGKWKRLLRTKPLQARNALAQVIGPSTVVPLFNLATGTKKDKSDMLDDNYREMIMEAIGTVNSRQALETLVYFAVEDPNPTIRDRAVTLLENERFYSPELIVAKVVGSKYLIARNNKTIQNAAYLLGRVGSESAIVPLINSLVTKHTRPTGSRPGSMNTVARGGRIEGLSTGGDATEDFWVENRAVSQALRMLSGETRDFEYDRARWKAWYISTYKHVEMDVRADDE